MKLLVVLFALIATSVMASEVKILELSEAEARWGVADIEETFQINEKQASAWVNVSVYESSMTAGPMYTHDYQVKIPGLYVDQETKSINIDHEGQIVECARSISKGRNGQRKVIKLSGRCQFTQKWVKAMVDNGHEMKAKKLFQIYLSVE